MYSVSSDYLSVLKSNIHRYKLTGTIGSVAITENNIISGSLTISRQCSENAIIKIGSVYASELKASLCNVNIPRGQWIGKTVTLSEGLLVNSAYEYVPLGVFYIAEASYTLEGVNITAYDAMNKFDVAVDFNVTSGTPYDLLSYACQVCGVTLGMLETDFSGFTNGSVDFNINGVNDINTYRDLISWIAQTLCAFATIDRSGALVIRKYSMSSVDTINEYTRFSGCSFSDFVTRYTGMAVVSTEAQEAKYYHVSPDNGLTYIIGENPLVQDDLSLVQNMIDYFSTIALTPFNASILGSAVYDLGDCITFTGGIAGGLTCGIMHIEYTYNGGVMLEGYGDNPNVANAKSATDNALSGLSSRISSSETVFFNFVNSADINITDGGTPQEVVNFHIVSLGSSWFTLNVEIKAEITTTETLSNDIYSENDMVATADIYVNNVLQTYHPVITEQDGTRLIHILHSFRINPGSVVVRVNLSCAGGSISIDEGNSRAHIIGVNLEGLKMKEIVINQPASKLNYFPGQALNLAGLVVHGIYNDYTWSVITNSCTYNPPGGTILTDIGTYTVDISYTQDDETFETSFDVEVVELDFLRYVTYTETNNAYIITGLNIANIEADDLHDLPIPSSYNGKEVVLA